METVHSIDPGLIQINTPRWAVFYPDTGFVQPVDSYSSAMLDVAYYPPARVVLVTVQEVNPNE